MFANQIFATDDTDDTDMAAHSLKRKSLARDRAGIRQRTLIVRLPENQSRKIRGIRVIRVIRGHDPLRATTIERIMRYGLILPR